MNRRFAETTAVSVEKSKAEIERLLSRYGATTFSSGWQNNQAQIMFEAQGRRIRFILPLPAKDDKKFWHYLRGSVSHCRTDAGALALWEQACRQSWRALALVVKAKLEAVTAGISEFESEFLANIVLPDGETVGDYVKPRIALAYEHRSMAPMLEAPRH